jgi:hypothetical protein
VVYSVDGQTVAVLVAERAALAHPAIALREIAEEAVNELLVAYEEGYGDACDSAWSNKQLRRNGINTESHTQVATDWFRGRSEASEKHVALRGRLAQINGEA